MKPLPRRSGALVTALVAGLFSAAHAADPEPAPTSWPVESLARLRFQGLASPAPLDSASLPQPSLRDVPKARVVLRQGLRFPPSPVDPHGPVVHAFCATAAGRAVAAADDLAFQRMDEAIEAELKRGGAEVDPISSRPLLLQGHLEGREFSLEARKLKARPGARVAVRGKHFLGYVGDPPRALLCSLACVEHASAAACDPLLRSVSLEGSFVEPPLLGWFSATLLRARSRPFSALGVFLGAAFALTGLALLALPRRRSSP